MYDNNGSITPPDNMMGGEMITGQWINKRTGKTINVRNTIIDGDNMIIISDAGQIGMEEFSRDYIQASDEIYNEDGKVIGHEKMNFSPMEIENTITRPIKKEVAKKKEVESESDKIIRKMFSKILSAPKINISIDWIDFPKEQLKTLIDYLDVSMDDISRYIIKNYMNESDIAIVLKEVLEEKLDS